MTVAALSASSLVCGYERDLPIVRGVNFAVAPGEFVAVLGPNGAGKSTFVKAIAGTVAIFDGSVWLGTDDITHLPVHERIRHGLAFVPQTENIFVTLTIGENLQLAADQLDKPLRAKRLEHVYGLFPDIAAHPNRRAGQLSGGQRQMLAVARALIAEPTVLILDEPSAGLSPKIAAEVFANLKTINRTGVSIILVEQNVNAALAIADRGIILVEGKSRHEGLASELRSDPVIAALYLGARQAQTVLT